MAFTGTPRSPGEPPGLNQQHDRAGDRGRNQPDGDRWAGDGGECDELHQGGHARGEYCGQHHRLHAAAGPAGEHDGGRRGGHESAQKSDDQQSMAFAQCTHGHVPGPADDGDGDDQQPDPGRVEDPVGAQWPVREQGVDHESDDEQPDGVGDVVVGDQAGREAVQRSFRGEQRHDGDRDGHRPGRLRPRQRPEEHGGDRGDLGGRPDVRLGGRLGGEHVPDDDQHAGGADRDDQHGRAERRGDRPCDAEQGERPGTGRAQRLPGSAVLALQTQQQPDRQGGGEVHERGRGVHRVASVGDVAFQLVEPREVGGVVGCPPVPAGQQRCARADLGAEISHGRTRWCRGQEIATSLLLSGTGPSEEHH